MNAPNTHRTDAAPLDQLVGSWNTSGRKQGPKMMFPEQVDIDDLAKIGPVIGTGCGDENLYFIFASGPRKGYRGYCKCL